MHAYKDWIEMEMKMEIEDSDNDRDRDKRERERARALEPQLPFGRGPARHPSRHTSPTAFLSLKVLLIPCAMLLVQSIIYNIYIYIYAYTFIAMFV